MKLSTFITAHIEKILFEWDVFAKTLFPALPAPPQNLLRDHAREILQAIVIDLDTHQTAEQQAEKSKGQADEDVDKKSAAAIHGTLRQASGFTLTQLAAEYRALRATVFRLWLPHMQPGTQDSSTDMMRFNEAMDQALAESVVTYSENADRTRDTFLAILGHDLRSPLFTMKLAGSYLMRPAIGTEATREMGVRVARSAANMTAMVNDLLEYARTQLGGGIPLTLLTEDMARICQAALDDAQAGYPDCPFELEASGDLSGFFDRARLQQLFSNLLNNAAQYRDDTRAVTITALGDADSITVQVCNHGPVIPAPSLQAIFDPLVQLSVEQGLQEGAPSSSLGLGLFIAREITMAHGGTITVASNEHSGTVFTVKLPRMPLAEQAGK
ncbi:MAG: putative two-component sensor histidine kinase [Polaromonas sp.]|nr:putative two-component sensor histidine kinase [Polaromonas sp.]MDB5939466.1 putative two-component sensor histidine kinase [Polaromonas sp.]